MPSDSEPEGCGAGAGGSCPQCCILYSITGNSRPLREECGHTRCYGCTFSTAHCPVCPLVSTTADVDHSHADPGRPPGGRCSLRSTSVSPCRYRCPPLRASVPPCRATSPAAPSMQGSSRPAPYYHHHVHGVRPNTRPGRRRSRRVSVPLPLPARKQDTDLSVGLYGLSPDSSSGHPLLPVPTTAAEEEDLYARFQLLMCSPAAAVLPPHTKPSSSGGSRGSSGPNLTSTNTSPFSTLTGSSEVEQRQRQSPEDSLYGEQRHLYGDRVYCSSVYASPRMGAALIAKPPLPSNRASVSRPPVSRPASRQQACPDAELIGRWWLYDELNKSIAAAESSKSKGVVISGGVGTGKTATIIKILDHVDTYNSTPASEIYSEPISCLENAVSSIASRVVAYHFCLAGDSSTCLVPDFVHSIANQLFQCPKLEAYKEFIQSDPQAQNFLTLSSCIADPSSALLKGVFQPLQKLRRRGKLTKDPFVILIDGLSESRKATTFNTDSLAQFLAKEMKNAPSILKFIVTQRSECDMETDSLPLHNISLDLKQNCPNESIKSDLLQYVSFRCEHSHRITGNIPVAPGALESSSVLDRFTQHVVSLSKGSVLYLKLTLNLIENGLLVLKSGSFKILPQSLAEIFLLMFNMKFPTTSNYEKHRPIFNVVLAAQTPLTLLEIYQAVNAGLLCQFPSWSEFLLQFKTFKDLLRKRQDNTYVFFHPALRDWLITRNRGDSLKFLCDVSVGHSYLALKLSRLDWPLQEKKTLELAYHIVQSKTFADLSDHEHITKEEYHALWITQSSVSPSAALCHPRNVFHPNVKISRLLLIAGASTNQATNVMKNSSILGVASYLGFSDFINLLFEFGANPNQINNDGDTPLILAASAGHVQIIESLVKNGADVTCKNGLEETALVRAAASGHLSVVSLLLKCKWPQPAVKTQAQQALVAAARNGHAETMDHLIQFSEEFVNGVDNMSGDTALTAAAKTGQVDTIKCLFQWRASKAKKNKKGETPLCCTVQNGHYEACKLLLDYGATVDDKNNDGRTALIISATEGHFGLMELLTAHGANISQSDGDGLTALSWACLLGKRHAVQYLVDQGADINHADHCGRSPLDLAAHHGSAIVVRLLMERGALIEHVDLSGMRPLDRAISAGNNEAVQCFLQKGAKLGPATWTLAASHPKIILCLLNKLKDDGITLCRKNRLKDAAHRFSYALRKIPAECDSDELESSTLTTLRLHLTLNLSRTKRKMNELGEAIQLANEALQLSKDSYESYYARAQAKRKGGKLEDALEDIDQALRLIPEICVSGNIHRCLTDVRDEILSDIRGKCGGKSSSSEQQLRMQTSGIELTPGGGGATLATDADVVMTSSILSESGYSSNF
uniref:Protein TANC2-like n=3 Tax=Hirondellea gigas TaxID=1518452 RepID=A0A6A7G314_9CRUS